MFHHPRLLRHAALVVLLAIAMFSSGGRASTTVAPQKPAPLATAEGPFSGVRVEVTELKRTTGETLSLRFTIINDSNRPLRVPDVGVSSAALVQDSSYAISGVHLIDLVGKKKYFVAKDTAGSCVCSRFDSIPAGRGANHWARFSAPPDDVAKLSIVIPSFSPMDDVPVSR